MQFITVYQLNTPSSENDIAIFFSYAKSEKLYNCYLVPHSSSSGDPCKVSLKEVDITHMNDDMQKNLHHKYLNFSLNPVSKDYTDAAEHHVLTVADNGAASLTQSLESSGGSTDSGQGSSIKEQNGQEGGDESETSSLEQSK